MPRTINRPPFPLTAGGWLACYRYRSEVAMGLPPTPEQLGRLLGVSGSTVRRWEEGKSQPSLTDIFRIAEVCGLQPMETQFLRRAFSGYLVDILPDDQTFRTQAAAILQSEFPAFLGDTLGYVRARNSYCAAIGLPLEVSEDDHVIQLASHLEDSGGGEGEAVSKEAILGFWFETAALCGTEAYTRTVECLRTLKGFEEQWYALALQSPGAIAPLNAPRTINSSEYGCFRLFSTRVQLPPTYYLYEFVPRDRAAQLRLDAVQASGPPAVAFASTIHW